VYNICLSYDMFCTQPCAGGASLEEGAKTRRARMGPRRKEFLVVSKHFQVQLAKILRCHRDRVGLVTRVLDRLGDEGVEVFGFDAVGS